MKEYANRIFVWKKDGCRTEKFYFKKWSIPKFLYVINHNFKRMNYLKKYHQKNRFSILKCCCFH